MGEEEEVRIEHAVASRWADDGLLWARYAETRAVEVRDALVALYMSVAGGVAGRLYRQRVTDEVGYDDYLQYARLGLVESIERFEPGRGVPFIGFAYHRMRGSILNGLARESELQAQRAQRGKLARERRESLQQDILVSPEEASLEELVALTVDLAVSDLLERAENIADESASSNPYGTAELAQLSAVSRQALATLPARERDLLQSHYFQDVEFRELAERWGLSKGRVSQLHARAIQMLRMAVLQGRSVDELL